MFDFSVVVPDEMDFKGVTFQWAKDGRLLPAKTGTVLMLHPAAATESGVYELMATHPTKEQAAVFRLEIQVVDPAIFRPLR